jgi:chromosome segregation ATPase
MADTPGGVYKASPMGEHDREDSPLSRWLSGLAHDLPDGEVAGYIALGGSKDQRARGYAIVQLPAAVGPAALGQHMERPRRTVSERIAAVLDGHAAYARDLEERLAEATAYIDELVAERDQALAREGGAEVVRALQARAGELEAQVRQWRQRAAVAEGEALRARLERPEPDPAEAADSERIAALEAELEAVRVKLERAAQNWREAEAKSDAAWRRVGEIRTELEEHKEQAVARSARQRRAAQLELARAREDASMKLVGVRDQLLRCEKRCAELEAELRASEAARVVLEARLGQGEEPGPG